MCVSQKVRTLITHTKKSDFILIIKFEFFSETVFDLPNPKPSTVIVKKCLPDAKNDNSSLIWQVLNPKTKEYELELPKCVHICQNKLPNDNELHNRTWREGYKGVGEKANYKCLGNFNEY